MAVVGVRLGWDATGAVLRVTDLSDLGFWSTLIRSETFWTGCVAWLAGALGFMALSLMLAKTGGRVGARRFVRDDTGAVALIEFVMLLPVLLLLTGVVVQFLILAQTSLYLHQAAYAAARSARVHKCPPTSLSGALGNPTEGMMRALLENCREHGEPWEVAARVALIPASQSSADSEARQGGRCNFPEALIELSMGSPVRPSLEKAVRAKACYAFEPENVGVEVAWQTDLLGTFTTDGPPPIKAVVEFRLPIATPSGMIFAHGKRPDGTRYRLGKAEVTLL